MSAKSADISLNKNVSVLIWLPKTGVQIRINGVASIAEGHWSKEINDYFYRRPYLSRIASIVSKQSHKLLFFWMFYLKVIFYIITHAGCVKRPDYWTGYYIYVERIEIMYTKAFRMHRRIVFKKFNGSFIPDCNLYP